MPILQYDIAVVGMQNVERALSSIERRFVQHNRFLVQNVARANASPQIRASRGAGSPRQEQDGLARSFQTLARVGMTADRQRYTEMRRLEAQAHRERERNIAAEARAASRAQREFRGRTGRVVGAAGNAIAGVGATALAVTGLGGGALIASRLGGAAALERRQRQLIVNARGAGQANPLEYQDLQGRIANTATATGASQEDVTAGIEKFVQRTGDLTGAVGIMNSLATASVATGSSMEDLAGVAADLQQKFDIKKPEEMADALAVLAMQGKKGAFELRDMANTFPELAAAAASIGMKGVGGMKTLGGLAQISRSATGSGEEASTALQMALSMIGAKGAGLQAGKFTEGRAVKVFSDKGMTQFRDPRQVIADVITQARGNIPELEKIFEVRGKRGINPLITTFNEANASALKGGASGASAAEAGRAAVLKAIDDAANAAGNFADLQRDASDVQKSANVILEKLNSELTSAVQSQLLPELVKLAPHVIALVPAFTTLVRVAADLVASFEQSPIKSIGELIAAKVSLSIAGAAIGPRIRDMLVSTLTGSGGTAAGGASAAKGMTAAGGVLANVLAAATIATLSVETFKAGKLFIDEWMQSNKADVEKDVGNFNAEQSAKGRGDVKALTELQQNYKTELSSPFESKDPLLRLAQTFGAQTGEGKIGQALAAEKAQHDKELNDNIARLAKEIAGLSKSMPKEAMNRGNSPSPVKG